MLAGFFILLNRRNREVYIYILFPEAEILCLYVCVCIHRIVIYINIYKKV